MGVGKTRVAGGVLREMQLKGKRTAIYITANELVLHDVQKELTELGYAGQFFKRKPEADPGLGIRLSTYDSLCSSKNGESLTESPLEEEEQVEIFTPFTTRKPQNGS